MIELKSLLKSVDYVTEDKIGNIGINKIASDSRLVAKDDLFVAIAGNNKDGHDFIKDALERGAAAVILERDVAFGGFKKMKVKDARKALAKMARNFYRDPSRDIKMIGITGTNGKTTISYLLEAVFKKADFKTGLLGTIEYKVLDKTTEAWNTTPSPLVLQGLIREMADCSVRYCVMEVSSHALDQHRVDCIDFDAAIFTNATREHLDYHKNFTKYLDSKLKLFSMLKRSGFAIINMDDPNFSKVKDVSSCKNIIGFGLTGDADVHAYDARLSLDGSAFYLRAKDNSFYIKTRLIGIHNVSNILAAFSCAMAQGIDPSVIIKGIEAVEAIPGRLQLIEGPSGIKVFVDFAHTDDALEKVLLALSRFKKNRIITVFGCGGNRDRLKRPRMGEVATRLSDYVVVTSDNPRDEDPEKIIDEIIKGIKKENFKVVLDRYDAVDEAISNARDGDIVLLAGKGHERYQIIKDKNIPFDDAEVARKVLKRRTRCLV